MDLLGRDPIWGMGSGHQLPFPPHTPFLGFLRPGWNFLGPFSRSRVYNPSELHRLSQRKAFSWSGQGSRVQEKHEGRIYLFICGQYHFSVDTGFLFSKKASSPPPPTSGCQLDGIRETVPFFLLMNSFLSHFFSFDPSMEQKQIA